MPRRTPGARITPLEIFIAVLAAATVIVDYPGRWRTGYGPIRHTEWDGVTLADLACPVLLFCLGATISLARRVATHGRMVVRAAVLIAVGLLFSGYPRFDPVTWRFPGVLQRAGFCYLVAATAFQSTSGDHRRRGAILVSAATFLTLAYWLVIAHVAVPGGTAGDFSPEGNLPAWVDRVIFSTHLWNPHWDPDGLLSTMSSVSTMLFGVAAGLCLDSNEKSARKAAQLAAAGAGGIVAGLWWSPMLPINRTLWSSSFMVLSAGVGSVVLAAGCVAAGRAHRRPRRPQS
jgi:predicted acyltransferase